MEYYTTLVIEDFGSVTYECVCYCIKSLGVEYIVSEKVFETLSPVEQKLWHSHDYEVHDFRNMSRKFIIYRGIKEMIEVLIL